MVKKYKNGLTVHRCKYCNEVYMVVDKSGTRVYVEDHNHETFCMQNPRMRSAVTCKHGDVSVFTRRCKLTGQDCLGKIHVPCHVEKKSLAIKRWFRRLWMS